jgi:hypothetical protein
MALGKRLRRRIACKLVGNMRSQRGCYIRNTEGMKDSDRLGESSPALSGT